VCLIRTQFLETFSAVVKKMKKPLQVLVTLVLALIFVYNCTLAFKKLTEGRKVTIFGEKDELTFEHPTIVLCAGQPLEPLSQADSFNETFSNGLLEITYLSLGVNESE
jgi:hypothetical protein